jgi:hypothetical protein
MVDRFIRELRNSAPCQPVNLSPLFTNHRFTLLNPGFDLEDPVLRGYPQRPLNKKNVKNVPCGKTNVPCGKNKPVNSMAVCRKTP